MKWHASGCLVVFLTRATRIFRKFPRDFNWFKFGEVSTGEISHEFNWFYFVRHVARIKFAQNSCCTSSKSITTHKETCYIFLHVYKLCFCPCCTSLSMYNTQFLLLRHVAATCPYNMSPRIRAPLLHQTKLNKTLLSYRDAIYFQSLLRKCRLKLYFFFIIYKSNHFQK